MKKIISLFQRNYETDHLVRDELVPGAEWVVAGEGVATRKFDGACCAVRDGSLYKRYDAKKGRTPPANFEPAQDYDEITGHMPGWVPIGEGPEDKWFRVALSNSTYRGDGANAVLENGTYEACGPHFNANPERFLLDGLTKHGWQQLPDAPRTFGEIYEYFKRHDFEGIVWHHPDGRMVKIKAKDFGLKRQPK
jgi:hypothetical protein